MKQAIEEKLKSIGLTVNIKTTQIINDVQKLQNTSNSSQTANKEIVDSNKEQLSIIKQITEAYKNRTALMLQSSNSDKSFSNRLESENSIIRKQSALLDENGKKFLEYINARISNKNVSNMISNYGFDENTIKQLNQIYEKNYESSIRTFGKQLDNRANTETANNLKSQNDTLNQQFSIVQNIFNLEKERLDLQTKIAMGQDITGKYSNQLIQIEQMISALKNSVQLSNEFKSMFSSSGFIDTSKLNQLSGITTTIKTNITNLEREYQKTLANSQNSIIKSYEKQINSNNVINKDIDSLVQKLKVGNNGKNENVNQYITELISLQNRLNEQTEKYRTIIDNVGSNKNIFANQENNIKSTIKATEGIISSYEKIKSKVEKIFNGTASNTSQARIDNAYSKFISDITKYQNQNGKAMSSKYNYDSQLKQLISDANTDSRTKENLFGLQSRFDTIKSEINTLGRTGKSVGQELDNLFSKIGIKAILGTMIYRVIGYFKSMLTTVEEVNTSMVKLKRVTSETNDSYSKFLKSATQSAKELSSTITDVIDAVASFSRLGYNIDDATILGNIATMYSNVGYIDIDTATSDLVTAMKAFNIEAENSISIVNAFNDVGKQIAQYYGNIIYS